MAKKKKRRRPSGARPPQPAGQQPAAEEAAAPARTSPATAAKRDKREEARQIRQAALRRMQRQRMLRRAAVWGGGGLAIVLVAFFVLNQGGGGTGKLPRAGARAAAAAGCTGVESPSDQGREHLAQGAAFTYDQQPPTSGPHDPVPLDAGVYDTAQSETNMVHSLEHGAVEIYYESSGTSALPSDVVDALKTAAGSNGKVIMTPAPEPLSAPLDDSKFTASVAFAAWDRLVQCPSTTTADQATAVAQAFIKAFVDAGSAPEHGSPI